ncbi:MAG: 50S ribosomal protein L31e, partial [Candidatus Anstonellaceae archaeon]
MVEEKKDKVEKVHIINLSGAYDVPRQKRAKRAIKILREQLARHLKVEKEKIKISNSLNSAIFSRSMKKPPKKIKVKSIIDEKGVRAT